MLHFKTEKPVLCAGDLIPDFIIPFGSVCDPSQLRDAPTQQGVELCCGGTSGNTSCGLAALGVPAMIMAKVGNDYQGQILREDLQKYGVDDTYLFVDPKAPSMNNFIVVDAKGDRYVFNWPRGGGAFANITLEEIPDSLIEKIGWVLLEGETFHMGSTADAYLRLAHRCAEDGVPVSIDLNLHTESFGWPDHFSSRIKEIVGLSNVVFGSTREEFPFLCSHPRDLVSENRAIVARDGRNGCTLYTHEGEYTVGIYDLKVSDTVGAGDIFDSGFIAAAVSGLPLKDCLAWGNACGNWSVQHPGGRSCPDRGTLLAFLAQQGVPFKTN